MTSLSPKKLLLTKWTAVVPKQKDKHFLVSKVVKPEPPETKIEWVELEALFSKTTHRIAWRDLKDTSVWKQGWI